MANKYVNSLRLLPLWCNIYCNRVALRVALTEVRNLLCVNGNFTFIFTFKYVWITKWIKSPRARIAAPCLPWYVHQPLPNPAFIFTDKYQESLSVSLPNGRQISQQKGIAPQCWNGKGEVQSTHKPQTWDRNYLAKFIPKANVKPWVNFVHAIKSLV